MPELLELLEKAPADFPPALLALAASYFDRERLAEAENWLVQRGRNGRALRACKLPRGREVRSACVAWLREASNPERELGLLKGLDKWLHRSRGRIAQGPHQGADGRQYWLCRRNTFLADHLLSDHQPSWAAGQSPNIATYCRHHMLVPVAPVNGVRISPIARTTWGSDRLHDLLLRDRLNVTLMARTFTRVQYPSHVDSTSDETVLLDKVVNEDALVDEVSEATAEAARERATILVFPELCFTKRMIDHLAASLAAKPYEDGPLLTVAGCCHRPRKGARSAPNVALLLGPDGRILHRHAKLTRHTRQEAGRPHQAEATETGTELGVLECDLGNLAVTICLDVFASDLQATLTAAHANLFLIPSLSDKTGDHRRAARCLVRSHRAATVVSNQHMGDGPTAKGASFVLLPGGRPYECPPEGEASPLSLIFRPTLLDSGVGQE